MLSTASTKPRSAPTATDAMRPTQMLTAEPTTVPTNAAVSSWPSMPMLMTATRSQVRPVSAPRVTGTARITVLRSMPTKLKEVPAAAQPRNANTNRPSPMASRRLVRRTVTRANWSPARKARMAETA